MEGNTVNTRKLAADRSVEYIQDGMRVGLGTGSTAYWAIQAIGARVKEGLQVEAIATSKQSEALATELGIRIISFAETDRLDVTIDGADEIDTRLNLIKGGGGALLREKIVGAASDLYIIIADETKWVRQLGKFPLPVEVVTFGWEITLRNLQKLGCTTTLRRREDQTFISDNGHYIIDCSFGSIGEPEKLSQQISMMPGVVDTGLFIDMADIVFLGCSDGDVREIVKQQL